MRITLNLASRPFADLGPPIRRLRIAMGIMALASLSFGTGIYLLHNKAEAARAHAHSLDGRIAAVTGQRQGYENMMRQPANVQLLTSVGTLNQLFEEKAFSWTLAMEDLETVLPGGVQVSTLEPVREKDGKITLKLRVIGPRDRGVELVQNLEHSRRFVFPSIVGENAESNGGPGEKLEPISASNRFNFDLRAQFNPATAEELKKAAKPAAHEETTVQSAPAARRSAGAPVTRPLRAAPTPQPGANSFARQSRPPMAQQPRQFRPPAHGQPVPGGPQ